MNQPELGTDLSRRTAAQVREIPVHLMPLFCASAAERFLDGLERWSGAEENVPEGGAVRRAVDLCWNGRSEGAEVPELLGWLRKGWLGEDHPLFRTELSLYTVEISLVEVALSSLLEPQVVKGLYASLYSLDFHLQLADLRRDLAGIGPAWDDPGRDLREFESDPGALAESQHQMVDAEQLRTTTFDLGEMRARSAEHGRRVLEETLRLIGQSQGS